MSHGVNSQGTHFLIQSWASTYVPYQPGGRAKVAARGDRHEHRRLHYHDADQAREHLEVLHWSSGPVCTHCKNSPSNGIFEPSHDRVDHRCFVRYKFVNRPGRIRSEGSEVFTEFVCDQGPLSCAPCSAPRCQFRY